MLDHPVYDTDGNKIGDAKHVFLDDATGQPEWVSVKTGLFGTSESFVPIHDASIVEDHLGGPLPRGHGQGRAQRRRRRRRPPLRRRRAPPVRALRHRLGRSLATGQPARRGRLGPPRHRRGVARNRSTPKASTKIGATSSPARLAGARPAAGGSRGVRQFKPQGARAAA
ncbi:PRC-barrel domain-containing protein [Streptomyces sp. NPDC052016]|uniref:PRC-barrel domain-containing protein n=1 Tax=Streptomyces sp. NPDC052016 TaxID=3365680 RepID=UPI0037CFFC1B